jgi:hypothetical protein
LPDKSKSRKQNILPLPLQKEWMIFYTSKKSKLLQTPVSSTNKTDRHDVAEIFLKVAFNTIALIEALPSQRY